MRRSNRKMGLWSGLDQAILFIVIALIGIGIVMSFAASPTVSPDGEPWYYLKRQVLFSILALGLMMGGACLSHIGVRRMAGLVLVFSFICLLLVLVIGYEVNGSSRWLRFAGFSFQPSETLKPALIIFVAWLMSEEDRGAPIAGRVVSLGLYGISVGLLLVQPDFGQTVLISLIFGAMLWASGLTWKNTFILAGCASVGAVIAYFTIPHVQDRISRFLSSTSDTGAKHQTEYAIDAISRGGILGVGPGEGEVKHILPEAHNDYVFAVAAEEFGLILSLVIITLYGLLFARAWVLAMRLTDPFCQLASAGLSLLFGLQAWVNIAVNLDMAPSTGMTLPFISYGGSSILALGLSAGLLLALTRWRPGAYAQPRQAVWT